MDGHQTVPGVPVDEHCLRDAQQEDDGGVHGPGRPPHAGRCAANVPASLSSRSVELEFPFAGVGPVTVLCSLYRGSRSRSAAFPDQALAPTTSWPATKCGSTGLIRGEPSRRTVPSIATPAAFRRAMPRRAISGAPSSKSCQLAGTPAKIAARRGLGCRPQLPRVAQRHSSRLPSLSSHGLGVSQEDDRPQSSYQPSSAITTSSDLMSRDGPAVATRTAPTNAMDPEDPILYPRRRSAAIALNVAASSTVISSSMRSGR